MFVQQPLKNLRSPPAPCSSLSDALADYVKDELLVDWLLARECEVVLNSDHYFVFASHVRLLTVALLRDRSVPSGCRTLPFPVLLAVDREQQ